MAHHIYNTEGIILDSMPRGEANRLYTVLTRDVGVVRATAQGVRFIQSKLKFNLQDFSLVYISLVRGKEVWRITNAKIIENIYARHKGTGMFLRLARIFALVKRLIPGEEKNEELFNVFKETVTFLETAQLTPEQEKRLENILVLKILHNLGYLRKVAELEEFTRADISLDLIERMAAVEKKAIQEINSALKETQL